MKCRSWEVFACLCALALGAHAQTPVIISQPQSITNNNASTAIFSVVASNAATYQWQFNGADITNATNATYTYDNLTTNQEGSYSVEITSHGGQTTNSQPAQLTIVQGTLLQITFSGYPDGSSNNVVVQLFDHDKPATVANFLHYVTPAVLLASPPSTNVIFSNMIWSRCIPGFVLQGGDYAALNRTNMTPLTNPITQIKPLSAIGLNYTPPFPQGVANESGLGPRIPNTFGTMAATLHPGNSNSAMSGFFFNLADNSTNLDNQNGGFTVFGRVVSNLTVLQYFNTLGKPNKGIFDQSSVGANATFTDLPVNFDGWQAPAVSNLFYADFTLLTSITSDTNPPAIFVNYLTNGQTVTNPSVVFQGAASDNVAVASVTCVFYSPNGQGSVNAAGTTNWTADFGAAYGPLLPGNYIYQVTAQDGSGNVSTNATGTFVVPWFFSPPTVTGNGSYSPNLTASNASAGSIYSLTAKPGKGSVFVDWNIGAITYLLPIVRLNLQNGLQITANFISNNLPADAVSITRPAPYAQVTNSTVAIEGKVAKSAGSVRIACQVFSAATGKTVSSNILINASGPWSTPPIALAPGDYIVQAVATNAGGMTRLISRKFTVLAPLTVIQYGLGKVTIPSGSYLKLGERYSSAATPAPGQSFLSWNDGSGSNPQPVHIFTMTAGLTLTVTFVSNSLPGKFTFVSPKSYAELTTNVILSGKVPSSLAAPQVFCQIFENNQAITGFMPATVTGGTWTLTLTGLGMGFYDAVAVFADASGHSALASDKFEINLFPPIAGFYHGIFFNTNLITDTNAGALSFMLSKYGALNGNLTFQSHTFPLKLTIGPTGSVYAQGRAFNGPLSVLMNFDFANFSGTMTGSVIQGSHVSPLTAYLDVPKLSAETVPATGKYALNFEPLINLNVSSWGDTLSAGTGTGIPWADLMPLFLPQVVPYVNAWGGQNSTYIASNFLNSSAQWTNVQVVWVGRNDGLDTAANTNITLSNINVMVTHLPSPAHYLVLGIVTSTNDSEETISTITNLNHYLSQIYTVNFMDAHLLLQSNGNGGSLDNAYIANGWTPYSLLSDAIHLNSAGYTVIASNVCLWLSNYVPMHPVGINLVAGNPPGGGFATVTAAANGNLAVVGALADNTPFSLSTGVFTNGVWPLFAKLDNGHGMLIGWETNSPTNCTGTLYWIKGTNHGAYYPDGLNEELDSFGAKFVPPVPGSNYQIVFGGGSLTSLMTNFFSFEASGPSYKIVSAADTTNQLTGTLLSSGIFSKASIVNPFNNKKLPFSGSFISPSEGGGGFTLDADAQTGFFTITSAPE